MEKEMKEIGIVVLAVIAFLGIIWGVQGNNFFMYQVFAPKYEEVRRNTFEQSKAFNQGMIQELQNMQFEYVKAGEAHKAALADIILHRAADYDMDDSRVPASLRTFVAELKQKRLSAQ